MEDSALVLLDYQEGICRGPIGQSSGLVDQVRARRVLENAATCLAAARAAGLTIAHVRVAFAAGYVNRINRSQRFARFEHNGLLAEGDADTDFCAEVRPEVGELVVNKGCVDPFIGTSLLQHLLGRGVRTVFLGGVATNMVVESAARHACDSGFDVAVLEDLCASHDETLHEFFVSRSLPAFSTVIGHAEFLAQVGRGCDRVQRR